jgi:hypothetical protein
MVHAGLLLIEGRHSTGFRFAHRPNLDAEWTYWPATSHGPEPIDPHEAAFDVDEMEDLEPPEGGQEVWEATPRRPETRPYCGARTAYWRVKEHAPRYGFAGLLSELAFTRHGSQVIPDRVNAAGGGTRSRASPAL